MKLASMRIKDFRQFHGEQLIEFASGVDDRNVTVFHGFNGSGKTALLNAFVWCLYGETTPDLESPNRLENERTVALATVSEEIEVVVELTFTVHGEKHIIKRTRKAAKRGPQDVRPGEPELILGKISTSGEFESLGSNAKVCQRHIDQMLPPDLYPFFFFNGERVERLASPKAFDEVEKGVKTLLDVEVYERAARHLRTHVSRELSEELKQFGDEELSAAVDKETALEEEVEALKQAMAQDQQNLVAIKDEVEEIERKQREIAELQELTKDQDQLRKKLVEDQEELANLDRHLAAVLSKNGYLAFGEPVLHKTRELIEDARARGDLPAKIKPQFVDDLLAAEMCICGRDLKEHSEEYGRLVDWRNKTGLADLEEVIAQTGADLRTLSQRRADFFGAVDQSQEARSQLQTRIRQLKEQADVIEERMGGRQLGEDAVRLADRKRHLKDQEIRLRASLLNVEEKLKVKNEELEQVRKQIKKLKVQDERAERVQRQKASVERVAEAFEELTNIQKQDVRASLDERISEIWRDAAVKDYTASVTENYQLSLTKKVGGQEQLVYGASTGEKQVLALSFVAALVKKAEENFRDSESQQTFIKRMGGLYPLVMDSPFGSLEDDYRRKVAEWVPSLAHQVIVMVSKTQWRTEVEEALSGRIGRRYVLELHSAKQGSQRSITLEGRDYPYVIEQNDPSEYTCIRAVESP